jgi:hypothetical protein
MFIIDNTYFTKSLSVPNTEEPTSDASIELETSIDRYVAQFLKLTLGNVLFTDLKTYIIDGELDILAPQKWLNLVNGCEYTLDGKVYTWQGLKYTEGLYKVSLLANFVYVNHYQSTINSQLGQIIIDAKNGTNADYTTHLVTIWNDFVEMYQGATCNEPQQHYRNGLLTTDYFGNRESGYVSYLQFLLDNDTDYVDVPAGSLEFKNSFGL